MIGIYLSGTGNTKHCVEKLVNLIDDKSKCVPLEFPLIIDLLKEEDVIFLGYPTQFSNAPFMVRDFIKKNSSLWKYNGTFQWGRNRMYCKNFKKIWSRNSGRHTDKNA